MTTCAFITKVLTMTLFDYLWLQHWLAHWLQLKYCTQSPSIVGFGEGFIVEEGLEWDVQHILWKS
jgi:hypothetical protein